MNSDILTWTERKYRQTCYKSAFIPVSRTDDFIEGEKQRGSTSFFCANTRKAQTQTKGNTGADRSDKVSSMQYLHALSERQRVLHG